MRKTRKVSFRRNNVSFHTRHEKWVQSIIFTGTQWRRVITSFVHSGCGPVENFIPRGIRGIRDAFSAHFQFIIPRQKWLSWLFVVGTIRRGNSCYDGLITDDLSTDYLIAVNSTCVLLWPSHYHPIQASCSPQSTVTLFSPQKGQRRETLCTSSLLPHSFGETYPFAVLACFFS